MLRALGSQAGEEDSSAFHKFSKKIAFSRKNIHTKLRAFVWLCAFLRKQQRKTLWKKFAYASSRPVLGRSKPP